MYIENKINIQKKNYYIYIPFELYPFCSILVISILFEILLGRNISKVSKQKIEGSFKKKMAAYKIFAFCFSFYFFDLFLTFFIAKMCYLLLFVIPCYTLYLYKK